MRLLIALILLALIYTVHGRQEWIDLQSPRWDRATVPAHRIREVDRVVNRILANRARYEAVAKTSGVPWHVIAALHNMESGGSFSRHLHEGSSLAGRTRYIPKGRPKKGIPPFTWEVSALDALRYDSLHKVNWLNLAESLYAAERYNGTGYLRYHRDVPSSYLWAKTSIEKPGKYIADGKWSPTAISKQVGVAAIWKRLESRELPLKTPMPFWETIKSIFR